MDCGNARIALADPTLAASSDMDCQMNGMELWIL